MAYTKTALTKKITRKPIACGSLALGIVGTVFSVLIPAVSYGCCIPGIISGVKAMKKDKNAVPGIVLNIVGLSIALINSTFAVVITVRAFLRDKK